MTKNLISGGFIVDSNLGWRWTTWITLNASTPFGLIGLMVIPETYGPVLLQKRAAHLHRDTNNLAFHAFLDEHPLTIQDFGKNYLLRPFQMLIHEPILLFITVYLALVYAILYLFLETYPISFGQVR